MTGWGGGSEGMCSDTHNIPKAKNTHTYIHTHTQRHIYTHTSSTQLGSLLALRVKSLAMRLSPSNTTNRHIRTHTHPLHAEFLRYLLRLLLFWSLCFNPPSSAVISNRSQAPPSPWQHRPRNHGPILSLPLSLEDAGGISSHASTLQNYKRICEVRFMIEIVPACPSWRFFFSKRQDRAGCFDARKRSCMEVQHSSGVPAAEGGRLLHVGVGILVLFMLIQSAERAGILYANATYRI